MYISLYTIIDYKYVNISLGICIDINIYSINIIIIII